MEIIKRWRIASDERKHIYTNLSVIFHISQSFMFFDLITEWLRAEISLWKFIFTGKGIRW